MVAEIHEHDVHQLTERIDDWRADGVRVDRDERLVADVALTGLESRNGYRYSEQALENAVPLYYGKPVFLDHAVKLARPYDRSTRDLVGSIVNARYTAGRVRGDVRTLDTDAGRTFLALAEADSPAVGMSHVVLAEKNAAGDVVETIHDVVSVDAVVFPATASTFREQTDAAGEERRAEACGEQRAESGELAATVEEAASLRDRIALLETLLAAAEADLADLRRENESLEAQRDRAETALEVEQLVAEADLPDCAVTESFRSQLERAAGEEARRDLINERRTLIESLTVHQPTSIGRQDPANTYSTNQHLIAAVRGRARASRSA